VEIDWRLGFTIMFYMLFAYTQSVLGSAEQKPGTRVGMGLGIMFCIDEILILQDIGAFIQEGQKSDPSVQRILSMFPQSYCTFEVILLARMVYFLMFNIICSASITFVLNDDKERVRLGTEMTENQLKMYVLTKKLHEMHENKPRCDIIKEIQMKPY